MKNNKRVGGAGALPGNGAPPQIGCPCVAGDHTGSPLLDMPYCLYYNLFQ